MARVCLAALVMLCLDAAGAAAAEAVEEPTEVLVSEAEVEAALNATPTPNAPPLTFSAGTRLRVRLLSAASTGRTPVPVDAETLDDVVREGRVAVPRGTRLEGRAFTTGSADRAQITFRSWIVDGRAVRIEGVVVGDDGEPGIRGKTRPPARAGGPAGHDEIFAPAKSRAPAVVRLERGAVADMYLQRDVVLP